MDGYLECPCCGGVGARCDLNGVYYDGQPLVCGCPGQVSLDCETPPYINTYDRPCVACGLREQLAAEVKRREEAERSLARVEEQLSGHDRGPEEEQAMRTKPTDPITGDPVRACDCWQCRYATEPYAVDDCPYPHYPHSGHLDEKRAFLEALKKEDDNG